MLTVGDQIYADGPPDLSLFNDDYFQSIAPEGRHTIFDCDASEVRRLFQMRYRQFFSLKEWADIHANLPCYPILDDHEIADNWGSDPAHQENKWSAIEAGAKQAYFDYQASRVLGFESAQPTHFGYELADGPVGVYVLDVRSQRTAGETGQLYEPDRLTELRRFLAKNSGKAAIIVVVSVPPIHLPRWAIRVAAKLTSAGEDFSDRWSWPKQRADRGALLEVLRAHKVSNPDQHLIIASGDIHIACVHEVVWNSPSEAFFQLTSSAITHDAGWLQRIAADLSIRFKRRLRLDDSGLQASVRRLSGKPGRWANPYRGLNLGFVELDLRNDSPRVRFSVVGHRSGTPNTVFESDWR